MKTPNAQRRSARDEPPPSPSYGSAPQGAGEPREGAATAGPARGISRFAFTADGAEYFRIWVVNLLLTLVTLGVYSAWAKVRKTRYFYQNTRLDGHAFDYHGAPRAILAGRVVALLLVLGYTFAFDVSRTAGLVMIAFLCVAGPWLFMRAQRFRLVNSSWRGLRFGFDGHAGETYRVVLPPLVIWFSGAIIGALGSDRVGLLGAAAFLSFAMVPWMHHRMKAYQHRRARYGTRTFDFAPAPRAFYAIYFKAALLTAAGSLAAGAAVIVGGFLLRDSPVGEPSRALMLIAAGGVGLAGYLFAWPYFAARLQAVVWSRTRVGDVRFGTDIAALPLARLTLKNVFLTLATAGLYWPFAAVALARYRVACMVVDASEPLVALAGTTSAAPGLAAGDAAADAFGLDIGL